jgi:hypothetical protein
MVVSFLCTVPQRERSRQARSGATGSQPAATEVPFGKGGLTMQIAALHPVRIDHREFPDPGARQILKRRRAQTARADHRNVRPAPCRLSLLTDLRKNDLPEITITGSGFRYRIRIKTVNRPVPCGNCNRIAHRISPHGCPDLNPHDPFVPAPDILLRHAIHAENHGTEPDGPHTLNIRRLSAGYSCRPVDPSNSAPGDAGPEP